MVLNIIHTSEYFQLQVAILCERNEMKGIVVISQNNAAIKNSSEHNLIPLCSRVYADL